MRIWLGLLVLGLGACGSVDLVDAGDVCFVGDGPENIIPANQPIEIGVTVSCLPACRANDVAWCQASVNGNEVRVESVFSYDKRGLTGCPASCGSLTARCTIPALPSGEYSIVHGDEEAVLEVGAPAPECFPGF